MDTTDTQAPPQVSNPLQVENVSAEVPLQENSTVAATSEAPINDGRLVPKAKWNAFKAALKGCAESTPSKVVCLLLTILLALVFAALFILQIAGYATVISGVVAIRISLPQAYWVVKVFNFLGPIFLFIISIQNALLMFDLLGSLQRLLSVYGLVVVHVIQITAFVECFLFGSVAEIFRPSGGIFAQGLDLYLASVILTYLFSIPASVYTFFVYMVRGTTDDPIRKWVATQLA